MLKWCGDAALLKGDIMWLPRDERKTLLKYYHCLQNAQDHKQFIQLSERAYNATCNLIERRLVNEITEHGPDHNTYMATYVAGDKVNLDHFLPSPEDNSAREGIILRLTLDGWDLARKYSSWWFGTTGEWWKENKGHWVWVLLGIIVSFVIGWLTAKLT